MANKSKPIQKSRSNRSAEKKDFSFHPYDITTETVDTAILLLLSKEPEILCNTLRSLTKFASQETENRRLMFKLNAVKYTLPHIKASELNIKRFALKLLAQLCQIPETLEVVLDVPENVYTIAQMLPKNDDVFVLEFATLILAELTKEPVGCEQLVAANILSSLFNRMKNSLDPDVQQNCLQTLSNLLGDPVIGTLVTSQQDFSWPSLLALMRSQYPSIQQAALTTVGQLICRYKDEVIQRTFKASTGILDLCDILESYEFRDAHYKVLSVLRDYVATEDNSAYVYECGCTVRLLAYLEMALPALKPPCVAVLTKMSFTENGRDALFKTGTDLTFCHQLLGSNTDVLADAALGVSNMTKNYAAALRMSETTVVDALNAILADETAAWFHTRINCLQALSNLVRIVPRAAFSQVAPKPLAAIRKISKKQSDAPIEAQRLVMQCYMNLLTYDLCRKALSTPDFMADLINCLKHPDITLKIETCRVFSLLRDDTIRFAFTKKAGELVVSECLLIEHAALRTALCTLIIAMISDDSADFYLDLGAIQYMVGNKSARYYIPAWEPALESIFRHHASAKFHFTHKLDLNDYTSEAFYVAKRMGIEFKSLKRMIEETSETNAKGPVYVCSFLYHDFDGMSTIDIRTPYTATTSDGESRTRMTQTTGPNQRGPAKAAVEAAADTEPTGTEVPATNIPDDPKLRQYLTNLQLWFGEPTKSMHYVERKEGFYEVTYRDKCTEVSSALKERATLLAEFVAKQMSGTMQERDCSRPTVDLHVAELMEARMSRFIPIGNVKCGGPLERAILYKILADRLSLPCSLHRIVGRAWCEVAVPEMAPEDVDSPERNFPVGLLRSNYTVDLMHGCLLPHNSCVAARVRGECVPSLVTGLCKCVKGNGKDKNGTLPAMR